MQLLNSNMIPPRFLIYVRMLMLGKTDLDNAVRTQIYRDLDLFNLHTEIRHGIYYAAKQYKEICVGCMDYTGKEGSYDVIDICPKCYGANFSIIAHSLGLTAYGIDRRVLSQIIYQALEGEDLNAYR